MSWPTHLALTCEKLSLDLSSVCVCVLTQSFQLFVTPWTAACQAPLSLGFSRQEYWSGLLCSPPGDIPDPGIELMSPALAGRFFKTEPPGKPPDLSRKNFYSDEEPGVGGIFLGEDEGLQPQTGVLTELDKGLGVCAEDSQSAEALRP